MDLCAVAVSSPSIPDAHLGPLLPPVSPFQTKYFLCTLLFSNYRRGIPLLLQWAAAHSQKWTLNFAHNKA